VTIGKLSPGMGVPAMIIDNRTLVPLRYFSEMLGCDVTWHPDTQSIDIERITDFA